MAAKTEEFLTLYSDPGEDAGWCLGCGLVLCAAGTTKMWEFSDDMWEDLATGTSPLRDESLWRSRVPEECKSLPIGRIVAEDWRLYPEEAMSGRLNWDQCRTARLIGSMTAAARVHRIKFVLQPAAIKDRAVKGAAEEFFYFPLRENRHQNDAIMHFTYYTQTELLGLRFTGLDDLPGKPSQVDD